MTYALLWRRDGAPLDGRAVERLALGLTRLRDDPVRCWSRGPLALWSFADDPYLSVAEHPAGFVAILAGRLDAFEETVALLGGRAALGVAPSDAEVLAAAYERWGRACFPHLLGDFAALVWHPLERTLLATRDRVGVEPVYWWCDGAEVVLAGHLGGVMAHPAVPVEPNLGFLAEVLADEITSREETVFRHVRRVVAAHAHLFTEGAERRWAWAERFGKSTTTWAGTSDDADERYREVLGQAVRDRLRVPSEPGAEARIGVELSGGLDSSTVAALAAPVLGGGAGRPLRSYSVAFPGLPCDETGYVEEVVRSLELEATVLACPPAPITWMADDVRATCDLPMSPNGVPWLALRKLAKADGEVGLLNGHGGDERFGISDVYPVELALRGHLMGALAAARQMDPAGSPLAAGYWGVARPLAATLARRALPSLRRRVPPWITDSLARETDLAARVEWPPPPLTARADRAAHNSSGWDAAWRDGLGVFDGQTGVRSLGPFDDSRVIEFALELPESARWDDNQFRTVQRRATAGLLPASIRTRTSKAELSHLFVEALRAFGGRERFANLTVARRGWVETAEILRRYDALEASLKAGGGARGIWPLWLVLAVETWLESLEGT